MGTKTCNTCHGLCYLPSGQYESCYSCGGRGYGASTDTSCMACGGNGLSTREIQNLCWNCHGTGTITTRDDRKLTPTAQGKPKGNASTASGSNNSSTTAKAKNDTVSETIGIISIILAAIVGFISYQDEADLGSALAVAFVVLFVSSIALYVAYYALKIAAFVLKFFLIGAFWAAMILVVSYLLEFEWATTIVNG